LTHTVHLDIMHAAYQTFIQMCIVSVVNIYYRHYVYIFICGAEITELWCSSSQQWFQR